jgi:hypothetical protein
MQNQNQIQAMKLKRVTIMNCETALPWIWILNILTCQRDWMNVICNYKNDKTIYNLFFKIVLSRGINHKEVLQEIVKTNRPICDVMVSHNCYPCKMCLELVSLNDSGSHFGKYVCKKCRKLCSDKKSKIKNYISMVHNILPVPMPFNKPAFIHSFERI